MDPGPADHFARLTARLLLMLLHKHRRHLFSESQPIPVWIVAF
jgi:hypothetical protein